ncbi:MULTISPECIES: sulfite reductase subunit alpha [Brenneria]|uniref:Sulfite reductase subunit alpha n=1 Tax=Brenneria nigrifluens DSM 30175 = ATCC 13028 TaxID=1121120 RepID=A0A2U1USR4_9GAMM|nr:MULTISPECIES: sulfite reductase subunit alpha [Brenneria]EHD21502.1 Nitrate reductase., NADPH--hemoprotein reductase [Brenneria sp. EniD312]PWC24709.1 sulfite reductase subunit alpha [Brenneria nigrifluens DSM 30175 = ATCC 13028]QCR04627.1 sulfite reductase subunit alpha [Brenneria nigrifluens DSM 30175 = ATCC 13028]
MDAKPTTDVKSVCPYCGVGCGVVMQIQDNRVIKVTGDKTHPANFGRLCTKGNSCAQAIAASGRLEHAYLRAQRLREPARVDVQQAIRESARRLRAIIDNHGPDAVALYVSGQMSLEAQYLANKLAKGFIGTNNIESNSRLCMASAGSGYKLSLGADGPPGSYQDFDRADLFFVIGANMADCHPILFLRMMERVKAGAKLIVVDPRRNATADKAHLFLPIKPGTDLALLNGLLHLIVQNGHLDRAFIAEFTEGWEEMPAFLADYPPERVARITGLAEDDIRKAAAWIGTAPEWMSCWTMGLNQSTHGTWSTNAICNLHLATGAICRPGSGPFSLTGQPNAMGGREMGYMGMGLPGQRSVLADEDRAFIEALWGVKAGTLRSDLGGGTVAMFEAMKAGKIKACWIICTNPVATLPNRHNAIEGLRAAELVIAQDAFLDTETNRYADILLPGALWAEAEGVMINSERNLTLMRQVVDPPGEAMADWRIIAAVACEMGYEQAFSYDSSEAVFEEIKRAWNPNTGYDIRGASYARLRRTPVQWPCPPDDDSDRHPIRYLNDGVSQRLKETPDGARPRIVFATQSGKGVFLPRPDRQPAEMPDDAFPLVLNTGRLQHQWHTMTKTGRIPMLNKLNPRPFVEIHPEDAAALGIRDKDWVEVRSRRGRAVLPAAVTDRVRPGNCFAPFHWNDLFGENLAINAVTSDAIDPISLQPEFKFCAVALTRVAPRALLRPPVREERALSPPAAALTAASSSILVLWASSTGNAEGFAARCAERLTAQGHCVALAGMAGFNVAALNAARRVLLVVSTFGDGDPPDNGAAFWTALQAEDAPKLDKLAFSVLALGDANYDQFCGFGRRLDARLAALGARRMSARIDCDADYQDAAKAWLDKVVAALAGAGMAAAPAAIAAGEGAEKITASLVTLSHGFSRNAPLRTRLVLNRRLNAPGGQKETRQFAFDLSGQDFSYEAGDALGVWPTNCPDLVNDMLALLRLAPSTRVTLGDRGDITLVEALSQYCEIARITPEVLQFVSERSGQAALAGLLQEERKDELKRWLWGRQIIDLLQAYPIRTRADEWLAVLKRLQPRLYSISSSPKATPHQVHLTVSTVRYGRDGQRRGGVCSTFLADRAGSVAVPIFVHKSAHFRPPNDPDTPMIMVGPGTGIAPFRAFLQERRATGAKGANWLLFGEQRAATDFYYREDLAAMWRDGYLHRLDTAFSRDQDEKIYVQHRLLEQGAELWRWLQEGAHFYVCGDAGRMARDVDVALRQVAQRHGALSAEDAAAYVAKMAQDKRYLRDVY